MIWYQTMRYVSMWYDTNLIHNATNDSISLNLEWWLDPIPNDTIQYDTIQWYDMNFES